MNIPQSTIEPFEPHGIPTITSKCVWNHLTLICHEVGERMFEDIMHGREVDDIIQHACLLAESLGASTVVAKTEKTSWGTDFFITAYVKGSSRRCKAFKPDKHNQLVTAK